MGTDLEATIESIEWQINYYITCCNPKNKEQIINDMNEFISKLKEKK